MRGWAYGAATGRTHRAGPPFLSPSPPRARRDAQGQGVERRFPRGPQETRPLGVPPEKIGTTRALDLRSRASGVKTPATSAKTPRGDKTSQAQPPNVQNAPLLHSATEEEETVQQSARCAIAFSSCCFFYFLTSFCYFDIPPPFSVSGSLERPPRLSRVTLFVTIMKHF